LDYHFVNSCSVTVLQVEKDINISNQTLFYRWLHQRNYLICKYNFSDIFQWTTDSTLPTSEPFFLFRISFYYHSLIGAFTTIFLGLVISYMTKKDEAPVDKSLISPVSHFLLSEEHESQYRDVESALEILETNSKSKDEN
jgi:hypothetical protein